MLVSDAGVLALSLADDTAQGIAARALLRGEPPIHLPSLADIETMSALRKWWLSGQIDAQRLTLATRGLARLPYQRHDMRRLLTRVLELRSDVTPYDAVYVALAEALGCPLATTDGRLSRATGVRCPVILVS